MSDEKLPFSLVTSQKGKPQLSHEGYIYVEEKKLANKVYWRCKHYTSYNKCPGRAHTLQNSNTTMVLVKHAHNHDPGLIVKRRQQRILKMAETSDSVDVMEIMY